MHPAILEALKGSIAHWKRMRENPFGKDQPVGWQCDLCLTFCGTANLPPCVGCPVMQTTGKVHCVDTHYTGATNAFYALRDASRLGESTLEQVISWEVNADAEIAFLESLLPNEKTTEEKED